MKKTNLIIKDKVFTKENIKDLANEIYKIYNTYESDRKHLKFTVAYDDSYVSTEEVIDAEFDFSLDIKKTKEIIMTFSTYGIKDDYSIHIKIAEGCDRYLPSVNYITISGNNDWVDKHTKKFEDILNSIAPQNELFTKFKKYMFHLVAINIGIPLLLLVIKFIEYVSPTTAAINPKLNAILFAFPQNYVFGGLVAWYLGSTVLYIPWHRFEHWAQNLWPSIELDFGPEHMKKQKNERKKAAAIISVIMFLVPIIIDILMYAI